MSRVPVKKNFICTICGSKFQAWTTNAKFCPKCRKTRQHKYMGKFFEKPI